MSEYIIFVAFLAVIVGLSIALWIAVTRLLKLNQQLAEAGAEIRVLESRLKDRVQQEELLKEAARHEFQTISQKILETESKSFQASSEQNLERLLTPLKERLKEFEKKVEDSYQAEGRERHVLQREVEKLIQLNERMTAETNSLTLALKGDAKVQGNWGELVLENILIDAGLREGIEFLKQESLENSDGERFRPDILIRLPDEKQIIVDAKVSLKAYEAHCRAETDAERAQTLKAHMQSLENHIEGLAAKHYPKLKGLRTPEFVFLFTPIESAYVLAMRHDPGLATRAWNKGIAIVTATTLFTSLRTVASIWRLENQNRNAQEIASEAAKLYDKFVGFNDDFEKVGKALESSRNQFDEARRKLSSGQGNIFRKIEVLRELGAAPSKRIRAELLESSSETP